MVKKIALISMDGNELGDQYIFKDICLIPILLGEYLGYDVLITTKINQEKLKETFPKVNFEFIAFPDNYEVNMNQYLKEHAHEIDIAFAFGAYPSYLQLLETYKANNPNGKTYLKLDMNRYWLSRLIQNHYDYFARLLQISDFVSAECSPIVEIIKGKFQKDVYHIPNGYYEFFPTDFVTFDEKKNIILTVGRLDAPEKQVMMTVGCFLAAELPDWELRLVGSMSDEFKNQLTNFISTSPFSEQVKILGPIYDKYQLEEEYRQAKIFSLTSKVECHAHVLAEAAKNGCFLMLTDIDGAIDITQNQRWGRIHPIQNWALFIDSLKNVTQQEILLEETCREIQYFARENLNWHHLIAKIARILGEEPTETRK